MKLFFALIFGLVSIVALLGCPNRSASEKAADQIEDVGEDVKDKAEDVEDSLEDVGDKIEDKIDEQK